MRRKLIEYEVFEKMKEGAISTAVKELVEAEDHLARALDVDSLKLNSFNDSKVIYETADGTYVRADYTITNNKIKFDDVEELVIDEETQQKASRSVLGTMLEAILDDNEAEANSLFEKYMEFAKTRQRRAASNESEALEEGYARIYGTRGEGGKPKIFHRAGSKDPKKVSAARKAHDRNPESYRLGGKKRHQQLSKERSRRKKYKSHYGKLNALSGGKQYDTKKMMKEWQTLSDNVFGFLEHKDNSHVLCETAQDGNGNVLVSIPTAKYRNEGKILQMQYDLLKTDLKILRETAHRLVRDARFCQAVADVKRFNNMSDDSGLEESLGKLVTTFPAVLYLTQEEMAKTVRLALDHAGVTNYDDNTCKFMAEGILRTAHNAYSERVDRILKAANSSLKESSDSYIDFQNIIREFFPKLDESTQLEFKVFEDLYNAASDVRKLAIESENEVVRNEASEFLSSLEGVLSGREMPNMDLASDVASWLESLVETNLPGASDTWTVVKKPHRTVNGDHPQMNKNAKVAGNSGSYTGDWGDPAPMIHQDKAGYKSGASEEARFHSWGNKGGKDVWPSLSNPYVPAEFGDRTMKGEPGVDKNSDSGFAQVHGDTWPELQNPYVPKALVKRQLVDPSNPVE